MIGNPLVILYLGENRPTFSCPDAIFIDMELILCREDILDILYHKRTECLQKDAVIELESECNIGSIIHYSQPSSSFSEEEQQFMENEGTDVDDLQGGYKVVVVRDDDGFSMNPLALMFNTELLIRILRAAIVNASSIAEDRRFSAEAEIMIGELKQILIAVRVSCPREENMQLILSRFSELLMKCKVKRLGQMLAPFFSMLMASDNVAGPSQSSVSSKSSKKKEKSRSEKDKKGKGRRK